ncbi:hypothetical protein BHM03_00036855 [Ensete ventricosum]|nr:hypothetical protein BHM03_00036855 [Ensete ventricosum]
MKLTGQTRSTLQTSTSVAPIFTRRKDGFLGGRASLASSPPSMSLPPTAEIGLIRIDPLSPFRDPSGQPRKRILESMIALIDAYKSKVRTRARTSRAHSADTEAQTAPSGQARKFFINILALEGGPMSQECLYGNSNAEHRTEPNHHPQAEEVTTSVPTPNCFWRMMTDPGFSLLVANPALSVVTSEAFLGLTNQVQALTSMVQTIVHYLLQLI